MLMLSNHKMNYKVVISGDRKASEFFHGKFIRDYIFKLPINCTILHGGCKGVDILAHKYARERGMNVEIYHAEWDKYGKAAGPIRNKKMLDQNPHLVLAFHPDLNRSKGTMHMINIAKEKGVAVDYIKLPDV